MGIILGAYLQVVLPVELWVSKSIDKNDKLENPEFFLYSEYKDYFDFISSEGSSSKKWKLFKIKQVFYTLNK